MIALIISSSRRISSVLKKRNYKSRTASENYYNSHTANEYKDNQDED
jgi:hypothetical protein